MSWTVEFDPAARVEALEAHTWYAARDPALGEAFIAALERAIAAIAEAPEAWPPHIRGTRRRLLGRFPYAVIYRIVEDRVQVIAIAHQRRRPGYWQDR